MFLKDKCKITNYIAIFTELKNTITKKTLNISSAFFLSKKNVYACNIQFRNAIPQGGLSYPDFLTEPLDSPLLPIPSF